VARLCALWASVLNALREELEHRNTNRAKVLAKKVAERLAALDQANSPDRPTPIVRPVRASVSTTRNSGASNPLKSTNSPANVSGKNEDAGADASSSSHPEVTPPIKPSAPTQPVDFGDATPQFAPEVETKPGSDSILAAWLTLEVLTPQALPDARELETIRRTLVRLEEHPEPWKEPQYWRRGKERAVYWMVYLGELDLAKATEAILKIYPDEAADERSDIRGNTTLAVMVLDGQGRPVEDKVFLSSFPWGYGQVRAGRLKGLASFPEAERLIKSELEKRLIRQDEEGKVLPLGHADIVGAFGWLAKGRSIINSLTGKPLV
jgi:hypothetical protein